MRRFASVVPRQNYTTYVRVCDFFFAYAHMADFVNFVFAHVCTCSVKMQINTEQVNTQRMLQHNEKKDRVFASGLQRTLVDVIYPSVGRCNIDPRESAILNVLDGASVESVFSSEKSRIESDVDAQILVKVKFIEKVDCVQITFLPLDDTSSREVSCPRIVKIYVNHNEMDFNDLESFPAATELELPFEGGPFIAPLAGSKFTRVGSVQVFVQENYGTDFSQLGKIKIEGFLTPTYEYK